MRSPDPGGAGPHAPGRMWREGSRRWQVLWEAKAAEISTHPGRNLTAFFKKIPSPFLRHKFPPILRWYLN